MSPASAPATAERHHRLPALTGLGLLAVLALAIDPWLSQALQTLVPAESCFRVAGSEYSPMEIAARWLALLAMALAVLAVRCGQRLAIALFLLGLVAFYGEGNLIKEQLRPWFLLLPLAWLGVELLLARRFGALVLAGLAALLLLAGSLFDQGTINLLDKQFGLAAEQWTADGWLAQLQGQEERLEYLGLSLLLLTGCAALAPAAYRPLGRWPLAVGMLVAAAAVATGASLLHYQYGEYAFAKDLRKPAIFLLWLGLLAAAWLLSRLLSRPAVPIAIHLFWLCLVVPVLYRGDHVKTEEIVMWVSILAGYGLWLNAQRRQYQT